MTERDDDIDEMAAEYVLGTLGRDARMAVAKQRASSPVLASAIEAWEQRLAPLGENVPDATPSPDLFAKIEERIATGKVVVFPHAPDQARLVRRLNQWRGLALAASVLVLCLSGTAIYQMQQHTPRFYAVMQKDAVKPGFLISFDPHNTVLHVRPLAAAAPAGKSYELWIIAKELPAPRSLGVIADEGSALHPLFNGLSDAALRNATLAVSMEPKGGSPTGAPTGPVVFTGKFVEASL